MVFPDLPSPDLSDGSKSEVRDYWEAASCGEELYLRGSSQLEAFVHQARARYALEPYIADFAGFETSSGRVVLEIGVGLGADHVRFAQAGADLHGCDLTARALAHTASRMHLFGYQGKLVRADAEQLPYRDGQFDIVYSWGVIHHSSNTERAASEIRRVLRRGGEARVMIYHKHSLVGYMLWIRYALLRGKPFTSLREVYSRYLESPGTKAYTKDGARALFAGFSDIRVEIKLTHGDLLASAAGQRHRGPLLTIARFLWPRWLFKRALRSYGLFLLVHAVK